MGRGKNVAFPNEDQACSTRRSPRTSVRKVKRSTTDPPGQFRTEPRQSRKRKAARYEDDPSYSEEDDGDAVTDHQKKVSGYRCSSHLIPEVMGQLSEIQRGWVKNISFDALQEMIGSRPPKSLTMWLVDQVDTESGTLVVCGVPIDIRKEVKRLLNLPSGGKKVPHPLNGRSKAKIPKDGLCRPDDKHSDHGRGQSAKEAIKVLLAENNDEVAFCQSFVMLVLCIYLAPTSSLNINRSYYPALIDVSQIPLMDWCAFIAEYLMNGIEEYRRSKSSHVQVPGCVHLLPLIYLDALIKHKALVLPEALSLPLDEPRVHFIRSEHLAFLASADLRPSSKHRTEYGLLQQNMRLSEQESKQAMARGQSAVPDATVTHDGIFQNTGSNNSLTAHAGELLDLLFKDITNNREKLFQEFHRKIVESELNSLSVFKSNFLQGLSRFGKTGSRDSTIPSSHQSPTLPIPGAALSDDGNKSEMHTDKDKENNQEQCGPAKSNVVKVAVLPTRKVSMASSLNTLNSKLSKCSVQFSAPAPPKEATPCLQNGNNLMRKDTAEIAQVHFGEAGLESSFHDMDTIAPHVSVKDTEAAEDVNDPRFVDELAEVVNIGKESAEEARYNDPHVKEHTSNANSLSILTEAAMREASPLFDYSPVVEGFSINPMTSSDFIAGMQCNAGSSSSRFQQKDDNAILKTPIFDKSPANNLQNLMTIEQKTLTNLFSIPEIGKDSNHTVEDPSPRCYTRWTNCPNPGERQSVSPTGHLAVEEAETPERIDSQQLDQHSTSYDSNRSETDDESEATDIPDATDEGYYKDPLQTTPGFILTPSYTYDTQEPYEIPDDPASPPPFDIVHIPPLQTAINSGFRFKFGCSISSKTAKAYEKFNQFGTRFVKCNKAAETYKIHVINSSARLSVKGKITDETSRLRTKIQIKRFHITKGDFVDSLEPSGEVSQTLMGLCSVAIMCDWETSKRVILDQATIRELMREGHECNHMSLAARLKKLPLEEIEEIFLPLLTGNHWILAVVNVVIGKVEFYDSLLAVTEGTHPHGTVWSNMAANLEHAYCSARRKTISITFFPCKYPKTKLQTNTHDCGFHVIQTLECYKSIDLLGHGKNTTLLPYRRYLSHVLTFHRFNDLNPMREGLCEEIP